MLGRYFEQDLLYWPAKGHVSTDWIDEFARYCDVGITLIGDEVGTAGPTDHGSVLARNGADAEVTASSIFS